MGALRLTLFFLIFATILALHHCREDPLTVEDEREKHHHLVGIDEPMLFFGKFDKCAKRWSCKFNRKRKLGCFCCLRKTPNGPNKTSKQCFKTMEDCQLTCRPESFGESGRGGGMGGERMGRGGMGGGMVGGGQAGF